MAAVVVASFERHVQEAVERAGLGPDDRVLVGFSGGADSLALTAALQALHAAGRGPRPLALHVNHRLRPEADADADRAVALGKSVGVTVEVATVDVGAWDRVLREGTESAARAARYAALAAAAREQGVRWVAVAHTANDQAETVLLRLVRGAGLDGLVGMREQTHRPVPLDPDEREVVSLWLLRPLLGLTRAQVERYVRARGLVPIEDTSNVSPVYRRNVVRHAVLPELERIAPGVVETIARTAGLLADDAAYLQAAADAAASEIVGRAGRLVTVAREALRDLHPALQRRVLILAARAAGVDPAGPTAERVEALRRAAIEGAV
ncbi:tRNA lysidine(34) synthetase TilS, partial [Sphaerobacter sp.]|uniref:tRNA lysidine(34) synthetase TilS n=1 Tax=Sphaerobacter sp. TaxID=2099654 RepID=UPI001DCFE0EA